MSRSLWDYGIPALTLFFLFTSAVYSDTAASAQLEMAVKSCQTPEQLAAFLKEKIFFCEDQRLFGNADYWQNPEEFLQRGAGDCEDYALLAREILKRSDIPAFVFSLYGGSGYAHTVCVFTDRQGYSVLNQDQLIRLNARTLKEVADRLHAQWTWGAIAERSGTRGRALRSIRNG